MNPHITSGGRSFKGAFMYYMHDRGEDTRERIAWTHTENMMTDDPDKAWKVMAYTAKSQDRLKEAAGLPATGRKLQKPVLAYSLSWHPDHDPDRDHMLSTAQASLAELELEEHEALIIAHRDTPHRHVHVMVNRVHPITGKVASDSHSRRKLSDFAYEYQKKHGMDYCPQREKNKQMREEKNKSRYCDPNIAEAWTSSDCGEAFLQALKDKGYTLAQGNKRLVVIDPYGKIHNPLRHLEGVKSKELKDRLADSDLSALRDANEAAKEIAASHEAKKREALRDNAPDLRNDFKTSSNRGEQDQQREKAPETSKTETRSKEKEDTSRLNPDNMRSYRREFSKLLSGQRLEARRQQYELQKFYNLHAQRQQLEEMREKTENAPWWRRLFGFTKRDREQLSELQKSFEDSHLRYREQMQSLKNQFEEARDELRRKYKVNAEEERERRVQEMLSRNRNSDRSRH